MQKAWKIILAISLTTNLLLGYILYSRQNTLSPNPDEFVERIDSLELELNVLREQKDSIRARIDTTFIEIASNNKEYEEARYTIINNSVIDDYIFFTEYLRGNRERLDSINHP